MHLKTSSKILNELPSLLELSTGRWVEAQNAQQEKAIYAQQSEWAEPGDAGLRYEGLRTRVFAFIIDKTQGPSVRIAIRCQSVNGANQILTLGFDADTQLIKYELLRLSLQENLAPMNNIQAGLFTRYPSRTDRVLNTELNQYCADLMLVRNKPTIDLRLNALNAGNLSFRKVAPGDDYALFHSVNPLLNNLTDTPDQPRICFRHLHIMPADHSVVPANNDMSNVQHFDVFAPVADAMNDVVRFSLRAEEMEYKVFDEIYVTWNVAGAISVNGQCDVERSEPTEEVVDGQYMANTELVISEEHLEYQFPAPQEPSAGMESSV